MNPPYEKVKYDCFFSEIERDMGASWPVCTYNKETDADYWQKFPYCEKHEDCPYYCSKERAFNIIHCMVNTSAFYGKL